MKFRETDGLIFPSIRKKCRPIDWRKYWGKVVIDAGIGHLRFHDLRHTAASNLVQAGKTLVEVGDLLGHSSTQMTKRYSHLAIDHKRNMVDEVMGSLG